MSKQTTADAWMADFTDRHEQLIRYVATLTDDELGYEPDGRWNAIRQLHHVFLCLKVISQALASGAYIEATFGRIDRPVMSFDEVIAQYRSGLGQGGKSPERFEPGEVDVRQREQEIAGLEALLAQIAQQISGYTDADLDSLVLPHPFVGRLTIREIIFLMTEHAAIHQRSIQLQLEQRPVVG